MYDDEVEEQPMVPYWLTLDAVRRVVEMWVEAPWPESGVLLAQHPLLLLPDLPDSMIAFADAMVESQEDSPWRLGADHLREARQLLQQRFPDLHLQTIGNAAQELLELHGADVRLEAQTALDLASVAVDLVPPRTPVEAHSKALAGIAHGRLAAAGVDPAFHFEQKVLLMTEVRNRQEVGSDLFIEYGQHEAAARGDLARLAMSPDEHPSAARWLVAEVTSIFATANSVSPPRLEQINGLAELEAATLPARLALSPGDVPGVLFWECLRYALVDSEARIRLVVAVYRRWAGQVAPSERLRLLERLIDATRRHLGGSRSFRPFEADPDPHIARMAFRTEALVIPTDRGSPMKGPRQLLATARATSDRQARVNILGGLLALGDRRAVLLLQGAWRLIDPQDAARLWPERGGTIFASAVEFFMDWIDHHDAVSGARVLAQMVNGSPNPEVWEVERKFPLQVIDGAPEVRVLGRWSLPVYAGWLLAELLDLERVHGRAIHPALDSWARVAGTEWRR